MSEEEFSLESLKKSEAVVKEIYPIIVNQEGKILDGLHRSKIKSDWHKKTVETKNRIEEILVRLHAHHRRRPTREETQALVLELAQELEKSGVPKENISTELIRVLPYSESYIQHLLPLEYKKPEKVEAGKVSAALEQQKVEVEKAVSLIPCANCGVGTSEPKDWKGQQVCGLCFDKLSRGEISLEAPPTPKLAVEEAPKPPPRVEKRVYEPGAFREEMRKPVSRMDQWVAEELIRRGYRIRTQEPICIKFVIPEVIVDGHGEKTFEKSFGLFLDTLETHGGRTLTDMENRELLAKRGLRVLELQYDAYTEEQRQLIMSEILSALQQM